VCLEERLEEVSLTGEAGEELINIISESYLDTEFDSKWRPAKIQLIHNKSLNSVYEGLFAVVSVISLTYISTSGTVYSAPFTV